MNYGKAFRVIRAAFNLSQSELAKILRIGQSHISLVEANKRQPSRDLVEVLSEALQVPVPLIILLASESPNNEPDVRALSEDLLRLLAQASDLPVQKTFKFMGRAEED